MGKNSFWTCDRCGSDVAWEGEANNGLTETMRFKIARKTRDYDRQQYNVHCYTSVVLCSSCLHEFENVYREFMGDLNDE